MECPNLDCTWTVPTSPPPYTHDVHAGGSGCMGSARCALHVCVHGHVIRCEHYVCVRCALYVCAWVGDFVCTACVCTACVRSVCVWTACVHGEGGLSCACGLVMRCYSLLRAHWQRPLVECEHTRWALCGVVWVHILPHWDLCVVSVRLGSQWGVLWCSDAM